MKLKKLLKNGLAMAGAFALVMSLATPASAAYQYNKEGKAAKQAAKKKEVNLDKGSEYHAYMTITAQESWVYRSRFFQKDQGVDYKYFDQLVTSLDRAEAEPVGGKFEDAVIAGNGHYTLKLTDINGKLSEGSDNAELAILGFTTDVPYDQGIKFDNVNVKIDGVDKGTLSGDSVYYDKDDKEEPGLCTVEIVNSWQNECGNPLSLMLAQDSIEISFDVTGFNYDNENAQAEDTANTDTASQDKSNSTSDTESTEKSSNTVPVVVGVVAVVVIAGVIVAVRRKK